MYMCGECYWYVLFTMNYLYTEVSSVDTENTEEEKVAPGEIQHNFVYVYMYVLLIWFAINFRHWYAQ